MQPSIWVGFRLESLVGIQTQIPYSEQFSKHNTSSNVWLDFKLFPPLQCMRNTFQVALVSQKVEKTFIFSLTQSSNDIVVLSSKALFDSMRRYPSIRLGLKGNRSCYISALSYCYSINNICLLINTIYLCLYALSLTTLDQTNKVQQKLSSSLVWAYLLSSKAQCRNHSVGPKDSVFTRLTLKTHSNLT